YAGGDILMAGAVVANRDAHWDGNGWSALGRGINDWVLALAVAPDGALYAGGSFTTAGGVPASHIARWDGASWSTLGSGITDPNGVYALALIEQELYVGGYFTSAGGKPSYYIAHWMAPPELLFTLDYTFQWNSGQMGAGTSALYADGTFQDSSGFGGTWVYDNVEQRLYRQFVNPCATFAAGQLTGPDTIVGILICRADPDIRGVWQGTLVPGVK
ncbi:MAG: hypothetical protein ACRDIB_17580, partial [Ardenticatenaceae bacterium]